jgi:hypothetical protein
MLYMVRGPVKDALLEAAQQSSADVLIVGRPQSGSLGRLRDLTYGVIRDALCPVLSVLTADLQIADLKTELNNLLGLPLDTQLALDPAVPTSFDNLHKTEYLKIAWAENPEILAAAETVKKAHAGVAAAKTAYIPDITAYARHSYQDGVPLLVHNFGTFGVTLSYDVFDFGKRQANVRAQEDACRSRGESPETERRRCRLH